MVSIGNHSYLALAKGGLTPDHVMVLPIACYPSSLEIPEEVADEISRFKSALKKCFKKELNSQAVFFERNYRQKHLQLQVVPQHQFPNSFQNNIELILLIHIDSFHPT